MDSINDIIASLSSEDIEALKQAAQSVFGQSDNVTGHGSAKQSQQGASGGMDLNSMLNPEMFAKLTQVMSAMNSDGGKRAGLIEALKPNLSAGRQKKADEAIQILKLLDILPMLGNLTDGMK